MFDQILLLRGFFSCACIILMLPVELYTATDLQRKPYNYSIQVSSVMRCPMTDTEWQFAAKRLHCNESQGYHCTPDKFHSTLIEFCYNKRRILVHTGNCLELAAYGILNHVKCQNFTWGCPDKPYYSNEIYKYPSCLTLALSCFTSDQECFKEWLSKNVNKSYPEERIVQVKEESSGYKIAFFVSVSFFVLGAIAAVPVAFFVRRRNKTVQQNNNNDDEGRMFISDVENKQASEDQGDGEMKEVSANQDLEFVSLVNVCKNGDSGEYYSLNSILSKNVKKRDQIGQTLLHHAVYGGNEKIFHDLLQYINLNETDEIGRTPLHLAARKGNTNIVKNILKDTLKDELLHAEDKNGLNPFCYAALAGHVSVIEMLKEAGFDIVKYQTKYGETLAHLACIGNSKEMLKMAFEIIQKKNQMDWKPLQYAAKSGCVKCIEFLSEKKVAELTITEDLKNPFHSACENGHLEACKSIAKNFLECIHSTDRKGRHAGHFAAKSGKVEVLEYLIDVCKIKVDQESSQNINILHIACRHGRFEMAKCIADRYPELVKQESKKGWNAALFLGELGGADDERIKILKYLVAKHDLFMYHVSRAGKSILYNVCANRSYKLCKYLLENYPDLMTIERSMDPRNCAQSEEIEFLLGKYSFQK